MHRLRHSLLLLAAAGTACASPDPDPAPRIAIPSFAGDDPRVETAGFVAQTLRLHRERDGARHTLMAFAVGDVLTLGAMVRGPFAGDVRWEVGDRVLRMPFDTAGPLRDVEVGGDAPAGLRAQGASFRGTTWLNVELPRGWIGADTPLRLTFEPHGGAPLALPADGRYRAGYRTRSAHTGK